MSSMRFRNSGLKFKPQFLEHCFAHLLLITFGGLDFTRAQDSKS